MGSDSSTKGTRLDQGWTKIELDELYPTDYLFLSQDPFFIEKNSKYCQNAQGHLKSIFDSFRRGGAERTNDGPRRSSHNPENRKSRKFRKFREIKSEGGVYEILTREQSAE